MLVYICIGMDVYICIYTHICIYMYMCVCVCVYIYIYSLASSFLNLFCYLQPKSQTKVNLSCA